MTIKERVKSIVESYTFGNNNEADIEKMVYMAYYIGREEAVKEVSDMYTEHIRKQHERAEACRYKHMANAVVGTETHLYHPDYRMDMTTTFGSDMADI